jgi:hypothetical protein
MKMKCIKCEKCFRDSYGLQRHLRRLRPCNKNQNEQSEQSEDKTNKCEYCLTFFSEYSNIKKHLETCKAYKDPIRIIEVENGIHVELPDNNLECRFCKGVFCRTNNLNNHIKKCKEREKYYQKLLTDKQIVITNNNNNTTTNNTNNNTNVNINNGINIVVNNFGKESVDHISDKQFSLFINKYAKKLKNVSDEEYKLGVGNFIVEFEKMISNNPENNNSWITNIKAEFGTIKHNNNSEEIVRFGDFVNRILINATKKLSDRHDTFSEENALSDDANELLNEAYQYKHGIEYQKLSRKSMKEITDNFRINKVKKPHSKPTYTIN